MNARPKIRQIARGVYECADAEVARAGLSMTEAWRDWCIAKVARLRARLLTPHLKAIHGNQEPPRRV